METLLAAGYTYPQIAIMVFIAVYGLTLGLGNWFKRFINIFVGAKTRQATWAAMADYLWVLAIILLWVDLANK